MAEESAHAPAFGSFAMEEITGQVILIAIISLFVAALFILLLHLYARMSWWRLEQLDALPPTSTSHQRRHFVFAHGQDPLRPTGLDPSVLRSIPVLVFKAQDFEEGLECAVCLSEFVDGEKVRLLPKCNHGFHVDCVDMWFQSHSTCPLCRNIVTGTGSSGDAAYIGDYQRDVSQNQNFASGYVSSHSQVSQNQNSASGYVSHHDVMSQNQILAYGYVSTCNVVSQNHNLASGCVSNHNAVSHNQNLASGYVSNHNVMSQNQILAYGYVDYHNAGSQNQTLGSAEAPSFPTNVLVWGNQNQVSAGSISFDDNAIDGVSTSAGALSRAQDGDLMIDIRLHVSENSLATSTSYAVEGEPKSPLTTRLRSLSKLLSREKRVVNPWSSSASADA